MTPSPERAPQPNPQAHAQPTQHPGADDGQHTAQPYAGEQSAPVQHRVPPRPQQQPTGAYEATPAASEGHDRRPEAPRPQEQTHSQVPPRPVESYREPIQQQPVQSYSTQAPQAEPQYQSRHDHHDYQEQHVQQVRHDGEYSGEYGYQQPGQHYSQPEAPNNSQQYSQERPAPPVHHEPQQHDHPQSGPHMNQQPNQQPRQQGYGSGGYSAPQQQQQRPVQQHAFAEQESFGSHPAPAPQTARHGGGFLRSLGFGGREKGLEARQRAAEETLQRALGESAHGKQTFYVMVYSQKGGVGKTTSTAGVGQALAKYRPDSIACIDTNPDGGSLAIKLGRTTKRTILDLREVLRDPEKARLLNPGLLRGYFNQHRSRLESLVLPPGVKLPEDQELGALDFYTITQALEKLLPYKIVLIDCGTDLSSDVMSGIRHVVDQLLIITTTKPDEATVAQGGLRTIRGAQMGWLADRAITLVVDKDDPKSLESARLGERANESRAQRREREKALRDKHKRDAEAIRSYFADQTSQLFHIPYDPVVGVEATLDIDNLSSETRVAYMEVAAALVTQLAEQSRMRDARR